MKRILILVLILLLIFSFANAELTIVSPTENQEFEIGEMMDFEISSDVEFDVVHVLIKCSGDVFWKEVYKHYVPTGEVTAFTDSIKVGGFGENYCNFSVAVADLGQQPYNPQADNTVVYFVANPNQSTLVTRNAGSKIYPGGWGLVSLFFSPQENYTGLIVNENLSQKLMDPSEQGEDPGNTYLPKTIHPVSNFDWDYIPEDNRLKFLLMSPTALEYNTITYVIQADNDLQAGEKIYFNGTWTALEDMGNVNGIQYIEVSGDYELPECPMTDQQLLIYIDQWSKSELALDPAENDSLIMQIIEVWKNCE